MSHGFEPRPQVPPDHYWTREYNTKERACSYWHQVDEILGLGAASVLEVGPGGGLVSDWLRRAGVEVTTLDMDPELGVDVHGSVTDIPLEARTFDAVLCCQVLEHLPFHEVERALRELGRVSRIGVVISVPDATPWAGKGYPLYFPGWYLDEARARMPTSRTALLRDLLARRIRLRDWLFLRVVPARWSLGGRTLELPVPIPRGPWHPEPGSQHFWEVGAEGTPLERLLEAAGAAGLGVERTYRVPENPWHRFLVLRPRAS
jgi:SAM-dependent methyltransferase